jgi:hypothetical protein
VAVDDEGPAEGRLGLGGSLEESERAAEAKNIERAWHDGHERQVGDEESGAGVSIEAWRPIDYDELMVRCEARQVSTEASSLERDNGRSIVACFGADAGPFDARALPGVCIDY